MNWLLLAQDSSMWVGPPMYHPSLAEKWLTPDGMMMLVTFLGFLAGAIPAAWAWIKQKRQTGISKEDAAIALRTAGTLMTAVNTLKKNAGKPGGLSPDAVATMLATFQDHAEQAGVQQLVLPAVEAVKEAEKKGETLTPTDAIVQVVKGATRKMRKTVLETPALNPEDMEVTPVEGNRTLPAKLCYTCNQPILSSDPSGEDEKGSFHTRCVVGTGV